MPAEIVGKKLRPARRDMCVTVMDDYGAQMNVVVPVTMAAADRTTKVNAAIATMNQGQQQLEACAQEEKLDLSVQKTEGLAKKTALKKQNGIPD